MDTSIFMDKAVLPDEEGLKSAIGKTYLLWQTIKEYVYAKYPKATEEWFHSGKNYGWGFRIKDKKRAIIYLLPRDGYFKAAFMFGQKATDAIMASDIEEAIKTELMAATVYMEGRGIRIGILEKKQLDDIKKLIDIKLTF
ncbi:MAG: DUF3788 family protein [Bacteroidota bacterium]|nr:DUF3788 family protein [Bacteroidota bacterium]